MLSNTRWGKMQRITSQYQITLQLADLRWECNLIKVITIVHKVIVIWKHKKWGEIWQDHITELVHWDFQQCDTSINRQLLNLTHSNILGFLCVHPKDSSIFGSFQARRKLKLLVNVRPPPHNIELLLCNFCPAGLTNGSIYLGLQSNTFICSHFVFNQFKPTTHLEVVGNIKCAACQSSTTTLKSSLPFLTFKYFPRPLLAFFLFWCNPFCGKSSKLTVLIICLPAPDEVCAVITKWDILSTASSRQAGFFYNRLYISAFGIWKLCSNLSYIY